jgi:hypothetical protein
MDDDPTVLNLRRNAYDFLNESIRNAGRAVDDDPSIWKFAIVNIAQAIELLLKERLRQEHSLLVYLDVDRQRQTVGVDQALTRLAKCKISFEEEDVVRIKRARDIRNNIVHYDITIDEVQLRQSYTDLFEFIHAFHIEAFGEEIHAHIENELWMAEASLMEDFRREFIRYQGAEMIKTFPSEILDSQFIISYYIEGLAYDRVRWEKPPGWELSECGDCFVLPGQLHTPGCDLEPCPRCDRQWITCDCEAEEFTYADEIENWIVEPAESTVKEVDIRLNPHEEASPSRDPGQLG